MNKKLVALIGIALISTLSLTACGSKEAPQPTSTLAPGELPKDVAEDLAKKIDVKPGQAVVPGSIKTSQQDLPSDCAAAVKPMRDLMDKYKSALLITDKKDAKTMGDTVAAAQKICAPTDFSKWYSDEFNGWLNGATK